MFESGGAYLAWSSLAMHASQRLTASDRELIQQLLEDVGLLESSFAVGIPKPPAIRTIFVPILRRWIAEGLFYQAQKFVRPVQATFPISSNRHAVQLCKAGVYRNCACADHVAVNTRTNNIARRYENIGPPVPCLVASDGYLFLGQAPLRLVVIAYHLCSSGRRQCWDRNLSVREACLKLRANNGIPPHGDRRCIWFAPHPKPCHHQYGWPR
jgi:hypothetical protein